MIIGTKRVNYRQPTGPRIVQVIFNADLRSQHNGLELMAKTAKVDVNRLPDGAIVCFINSARNKIKFLTANRTLAYYRSPDNRQIDLSALNFINAAFLIKGEVDYDSALRKSLEERIQAVRAPMAKEVVEVRL